MVGAVPLNNVPLDNIPLMVPLPDAVIVRFVADPEQMVVVPPMDAVGRGFTVTVAVPIRSLPTVPQRLASTNVVTV